MIRLIAAIDSNRGIADDHGIPWQGKLPTDVKQYHDKFHGHPVLYGIGMYNEMPAPYKDSVNYVISDLDQPLRPGFTEIRDLQAFLREPPEDLWVLGGAGVFAQTIGLADELYITQLDGDFGCTKFFPEFAHDFELADEQPPQTENGITFRFQVWKRKK